jgi:hypothetical protein
MTTEPSQRCYFCRQPIQGDGFTMWVDDVAFHCGEPPDEKELVITEPLRLCPPCHDTHAAVESVRSDLRESIPPPVRIGGHLVRAFDRGFHAFEHPGQFSGMTIEVYQRGPSFGTWSFDYFYGEDVVQIGHIRSRARRPDGSFAGGAYTTIARISAEHWRSNAVEVVSQQVGAEIATGAAPMLQVPKRDEVDETLNQEWARLLDRLDEQDAGKRERSDGFLDRCWDRGALTLEEVEIYRAAWAEGRSVRNWDEDDEGLGWNDESDDEDAPPIKTRGQSRDGTKRLRAPSKVAHDKAEAQE